MANDLTTRERTLKALANKRRIAIVRYVKKQKEASVGDIADAIRLSFKATSKHLNILLAAGILDREQKSLQNFYRLDSDATGFIRSLISFL